MKTLTKILIGTTLGILLVPSVSFAAWWQPSTWFKKPTTVLQESTTTPQTRSVVAKPVVTPVVKNADQASEIEKLRKEVAELKKAQTKAADPNVQAKVNTQTPPVRVAPTQKKTFTLPSGAVVDEQGNILNQEEFSRIQAVAQKSQVDEESRQQAQVADNLKRQQQAQQQVVQQEELKRAQVEQQRTAQLNSLLLEYKQKEAQIKQQIIDVKQKYYQDVASTEKLIVSTQTIYEREKYMLNEANRKIEQLGIQLDQLKLDYQQRVQSVQ